jgi:ferric-dicitrate binding protein FerR (iron transport regulator)
MHTNDEIMRIIAATLKGYANSQELGMLQAWLHEDPANREKYEMMEKIWQESGFVLSAPAFDVRKGWERLNGTIAASAERKIATRTPLRLVLVRRIAIAAVIVGAALIGWYLWNSQSTHLQTFIAETGNQALTLPDNSVVLVRKGSSIRYSPTFDKSDRVVYLTGEAWFEVTHLGGQPFTVFTDHSGVRVLGTSFLVKTNNTGDDIVVVTGKVNVIDNQKADNGVILTAGHQVTLNNGEFRQAPVTDSNFIAWKTGVLNFKDAPLSKVLNDIAHYYGVIITLAGDDQSAAAALPVTARFQNQSLDQVLDEVKMTTGWKAKNDAGDIIFSRHE